MTKFFPRQLLYRLRNEIPVATLLTQLDWPHKQREGRFCFLCPRCGEFLAAVNPRTNLARCFACEGFQAMTARDGEVGLDVIQRHPPDLIVLDLMLPSMSG